MGRYGIGGSSSFNYNRSRAIAGNAIRQGGTGATYSGSQNIIRHANSVTATIGSGKTQAFNLVMYNPTFHGTPVDSDGSSSKVLTNNYTDKGSRVDYVTMQLTVKQTDTSKNNTCYLGLISTSFNQGRLSADLMTTNFFDFISSNTAGEMTVASAEKSYTLNTYSLNDIQQHNIRGLLNRQMQLYSGRVITANSTIPLPRRNRRQQEGSAFALVIMNDSEGPSDGTDVEIRLDTFFKEIPVNSL
tara:strand:+ start:899 stop:1630 length:732 start_codon:yes stop_codon:yes gene_type:complete